MGATAISAYRQGYVQNIKDRKDWASSIAAGQLPVERGLAFSPQDRLRALAINTLMCTLRADTADICRQAGARPDSLQPALGQAQRLARDGLCSVSGTVIEVPEEARVMLRTVAQCFDKRSAMQGPPRYARAV